MSDGDGGWEDLDLAHNAVTSERARDALAGRLAPRVRRLMAAFLRDAADREEAAQWALREIVRAAASFRGHGSLEGWADRIAARAGLRLSRARRLRIVRSGPPASPSGGGEQPLLSEALEAVLAPLPESQRSALVLRQVLGYSVAESAELAATTAEIARQRLLQARASVRAERPAEPCRAWAALSDRLVLGEALTESERAQLEVHPGGCASCRSEVALFRELAALLTPGMPSLRPALPSRGLLRVVARARRAGRRATRRRAHSLRIWLEEARVAFESFRLPRFGWGSLAFIALCLGAASVLALRDLRSTSSTHARASAAPDRVEVELPPGSEESFADGPSAPIGGDGRGAADAPADEASVHDALEPRLGDARSSAEQAARHEPHAAHVAYGEMLLADDFDPLGALASFERYLVTGGALAEEASFGRIRALRSLGRLSDERRAIGEFLEAFPDSVLVSRLRARERKLRVGEPQRVRPVSVGKATPGR